MSIEHEMALPDDEPVNEMPVQEGAATNENPLSDSEQYFRAFFDITSVGICEALPFAGTLLRFNRGFAEMTGYIEAELVGRPFSDITHPEDCEANIQNFVRLCRGEIPKYRVRKRYLRKDGSIMWGDVTLNIVRDGGGTPVRIMAIVQDVTESKNSEDAVRQSEERLRTLADAMPHLVWRSHSDGVVDYYNARLSEYDGIISRNNGAWDWQPVVHPDDLAATWAAWRSAVADGRIYQFEHRLRMRDGSYRWHLSRALPVRNSSGAVTNWFGTATDIHDQKQAHADLNNNQELLRRAGESLSLAQRAAKAGVWDVDFTAGTTFVTPEYRELYGLTPDEPVSFQRWLEELVHPADRTRVAQHRSAVLGSGAELKNEFRIIHPQRGELWMLAIGKVSRDETGRPVRFTGITVDTTDRKRADEALRHSDARFRMATDAMNGLVYEWDVVNGKVERSRGISDLVGYDPGELPPSRDWWLARVHPDDLKNFEPRLEQAIAQRASSSAAEYRVRDRDGKWVWVWDQCRILYGDAGRPVRIVGCTISIDERKRLEQELNEHVRALNEADRRKDEFIATLAHELRNPLAPIRSAIELFRLCTPGDADFQWGRQVIEQQIGHMVRLLEDLLDVSRITRNKLELRLEKVLLTQVIDAAADAVRPALAQAEHNFVMTVPKDAIELNGDRVRLTQIIVNLLNNAAKYTAQGGRIELAAERSGGAAVVRIKDNGIGIEPEKLPFIFGMFYQANRSYEQGHGGLGIGLTLVKQLVEMHGGTVEASSAGINRGCEFVVRLPLAAAEHEALRNRRWAQEGTAAARRILVVDDYPNAAESLARWLRRMGNEVYTALDGREGVTMAEKVRPDLVLLDLGMPKLDGYEAAAAIRAQPWGREMVLVALTGWGQPEDRQRTQAAGFRMHLVKPVDHAQLNSLLETLVQ